MAQTPPFTLGTCLRFLGIGLLIASILFYVQFQARNLIIGPTLSLAHEPTVVQHEKTLVLQGTARNIVKLSLNGREIHTNEAGDWSELIVLERGYGVVTLTAEDRFGRETTLTREYVYVPQS